MAAASGPVDASSGESETPIQTDDFKSPEPPRHQLQEATEASKEKQDGDTFKVPVLNSLKKESDPTSKPSADTDTDSEKDSNLSKTRKESEQETADSDKKNKPSLSPAELLKQTQVTIPYKEPIWGGVPPESEKYSFDVLKNGTLIDNIELGEKPWLVFGRLPSCDVFMEHPSLSRHHAVVQYRDTSEGGHERGWYLYDLDSTHGTWVNKVKVKPKVYRRLRVGHVVKFGGSTRLFILQGPEEDQEPESELSVSELKQRTEKLKREAEALKLAEQAEIDQEDERERQRQKILDARGCSWGMGEDATEEPDEESNPFTPTNSNIVPQHEHLYSDDPKKALKGFYEREGFDLPDYQFTEVGYGKHKCVVELPVDGPNGEILVAEATVSGKKKDAVVACALEACRMLDIHGLLHASKHEGRKRKSKNWEEDDFYDSDEDTFLDRTGTIEKKRIFRMQKSGKDVKAETYETLVPKYEEVKSRISEIEHKLEQAKAQTEAAASEEEDALDAYMTAIKAGVMDTKTRLALKRELLTLKTEEMRLRKLVNLAKPADMPELKKLETGANKLAAGAVPAPTAVRKIGVAKVPKKPLPLPVATPVQTPDTEFKEEVEEDEEVNSSDATKSAPATSDNQTSKTTSMKRELPSQEKSPMEQTSKKEQGTENSENSSSTESPKMYSAMLPPALSASQGPKSVKRKEPVIEKETPIKGPTMPSSVKTSLMSRHDAEESAKLERAAPPVAKKKKKGPAPGPVEYDASDPDYAVWMPPQNQSGDGRTKLNDRLGY